MDATIFKKDFLEGVKATATLTGEGSSATFAEQMAQYLEDAEALGGYSPCFYTNRLRNRLYRVDGYHYDELDSTMNIIIADYDALDPEHTLTKAKVDTMVKRGMTFLEAAYQSSLRKDIEPSTPVADFLDLLWTVRDTVKKYTFFVFTNGNTSSSIKALESLAFGSTPVDVQIWDLARLYRICASERGREVIEIDFTEYCPDGIPCLDAGGADGHYRSYLGVLPGNVLADVYDRYGSRLLEGNVRSFLSSKVAVNKKIRATILTEPNMFFAFNNGISVTASSAEIHTTQNGSFMTSARDLQIINGGQTTASLAMARYKDKASLDDLFVQMKLTILSATDQDEADSMIANISRSSNTQNKVSDADFFASHPFHRRMEQISRTVFAPAVEGAQYETRWFYERARGQYVQAQMRMTPAQRKHFLLQHPKSQLITKTDLAKAHNAWEGKPHVVSKGAQTNFVSFAEWLSKEWEKDESQFNERYFQSIAALLIMFRYLEKAIPRQYWYENGYRANIIYYTIALFRLLIQRQFPGYELDLGALWSMQSVPAVVGDALIQLAERAFAKITDDRRLVMNVTQWCKREECWDNVKQVQAELPTDLRRYLHSKASEKEAAANARKTQKINSGIDAEILVTRYPSELWGELREFALETGILRAHDMVALSVACDIPRRMPTSAQSKRLLDLLRRAAEEGFPVPAATTGNN